jgi:ribonuclease D
LEIPEEFLPSEVTPTHPGKETIEGYKFIDNLTDLKVMLEALSKAKEIAVDLEHHSYRSFLGFTCLIQISTRTFDYIVDAIALREHLHLLNTTFTNPKILKVFHGADMDIKWLQRDFGVYVVNLFDTHKAIQHLGRSPFTFASLLQRYCNETTDKEFQLADWRVRPLSHDMTKYARRDTHFLLYIADRLMQDIISRAKEENKNPREELVHVFNMSKDVSLLQFRKPQLFSRQFYSLYETQSNIWSSSRMGLFKELWTWRNTKAREDDESETYVLNTNFLLELVSKLPTTMSAVANLRRKFTRKTTECMSELLSLIARYEERIKTEDSEGKSVPARITNFHNKYQTRPQGKGEGILKPDAEFKELVLQLKHMDVKVGDSHLPKKASTSKHGTEGKNSSQTQITVPTVNLVKQIGEQKTLNSKKSSSQKHHKESSLEFASPLDVLRSFYPGMQITPPKKKETLVASTSEQNMQQEGSKVQAEDNADDLEYIEIGGKNKNNVQLVNEVDEGDILDRVNLSSLPQSLKEKFKVDLVKIKKKDFTQKVVEQVKNKNKPNELQSASREMFQKGNVFDLLKNKDTDKASDEEEGDKQEEAEPKKGFWEVYEDIAKKKAPHMKQQVGHVAGERHQKKKDNGHRPGGNKRGGGGGGGSRFSQPSNKGTIRY